MMTSYVVLITDEDRPESGEVKVIQGESEVARYIEMLLEGGFSQDRIRVFMGTEVTFEVSYRPVVSLAPSVEEPAPVLMQPGQDERESEVATAREGEPEEIQGTRNGVRFSELFRPS